LEWGGVRLGGARAGRKTDHHLLLIIPSFPNFLYSTLFTYLQFTAHRGCQGYRPGERKDEEPEPKDEACRKWNRRIGKQLKIMPVETVKKREELE
jgi:hypothetical protein